MFFHACFEVDRIPAYQHSLQNGEQRSYAAERRALQGTLAYLSRAKASCGGLSSYLLVSSDSVSDAIECRTMPVRVKKVPTIIARIIRIAGPFGTRPHS